MSNQTYCRWQTGYGEIDLRMALQMKALEKDNGRFKRLVADQALDTAILKEAARPRLRQRMR